MNTIYFLQGLPASGKSTWAHDMVKKNPGKIMRINKDDIRAMCHSSVWSKANEEQVLGVRDAVINVALSLGNDVIVDDTNFAPYHLETIKKIAEQYTANVEVKFFDVPVETCIERDALRGDKSVGKTAILDMFNRYLAKGNLSAEFAEVVQDNSLPPAIIVDIDGTLASKCDRDWYDYSKVDGDKYHFDIIELVQSLSIGSNKRTILFMSGRDDSCFDATNSWLGRFFTTQNYLFMRKTGDKRGDDIVKHELYQQNVAGKWRIDYVVDDRAKVCRMWRQLGFRCLQVATGDF